MKVAEHDSGLASSLFGSTDMHLIRKSPLPVWTINAARKDTPRRVLATVDPLATDLEARELQCKTLRVAAELAGAYAARFREQIVTPIRRTAGPGPDAARSTS